MLCLYDKIYTFMILSKFPGCPHGVLSEMFLPRVMYFCLIVVGKGLVSRMGKTKCGSLLLNTSHSRKFLIQYIPP